MKTITTTRTGASKQTHLILECESCRFTERRKGWDSDLFRKVIVPYLKCPKCKAKSPEGVSK